MIAKNTLCGGCSEKNLKWLNKRARIWYNGERILLERRGMRYKIDVYNWWLCFAVGGMFGSFFMFILQLILFLSL